MVGGRATDTESSVEFFDLKDQRWYQCWDTTEKIYQTAGGVVVIDNKVYFIGGSLNKGPCLNMVKIYDTETNTWSLGPPMKVRRSMLGVAVLENKIYAVRIQKFETYSPLCDDVSFL